MASDREKLLRIQAQLSNALMENAELKLQITKLENETLKVEKAALQVQLESKA